MLQIMYHQVPHRLSKQYLPTTSIHLDLNIRLHQHKLMELHQLPILHLFMGTSTLLVRHKVPRQTDTYMALIQGKVQSIIQVFTINGIQSHLHQILTLRLIRPAMETRIRTRVQQAKLPILLNLLIKDHLRTLLKALSHHLRPIIP